MQIDKINSTLPTTFQKKIKLSQNQYINNFKKNSFIDAKKAKFYVKNPTDIRHGIIDSLTSLTFAPLSALSYSMGNQSLGLVLGACSALKAVCAVLAFACGIGRK